MTAVNEQTSDQCGTRGSWIVSELLWKESVTKETIGAPELQ
jgi:hypothetical protein